MRPRKRHTRQALAVFGMLLALFSYKPSLAFDLSPEFHSLSEDEPLTLDDLQIIDSEYQSDYLTYLTSLAWQQEFGAASDSFLFSLGSLSNKIFMHHSQLKLAKNLSESWQFRLTSFQQRDLDIDQRHLILELVKTLTPRLALSLYGEPSLFKRENDFGLALIVRVSGFHDVRLFHTWVDFTRQDHNDQSDLFVAGREPRSLGFVGRCQNCLPSRSCQSSLEYFARWETPTQWQFPDTEKEYSYETLSFGGFMRFAPLSSDTYFNLRLQHSRKTELFSPLPGTSTAPADALDRRLSEALFSAEVPIARMIKNSPDQNYVLEPGLAWFNRRWEGPNDAHLEFESFLPFTWFHWQWPKGDSHRDRLSLGYEVTFFKARGELTLAAPQLKAATSEHRANLRYTLALLNNADLSLTLTADLDDGSFEGGNGQFKVFF